jgi:hypothetical protein
MTVTQWRELIEAFVFGRISADAFKRRFMEAFAQATAARVTVPAAVQDLAYVVDAYAGDPMARGHDVADDEQLMVAAREALARLPAENLEGAPGSGPMRELEPEEAAAHVRRAAFTVGAIGAVGCLFMVAWFAIGIMQFFAASAQVQAFTAWGPAPSTVIGLVLAFVPVIGSVVAFFGAKDVWGWNVWAAGAVFFAIPAATMISGWIAMGRRRLGRAPMGRGPMGRGP